MAPTYRVDAIQADVGCELFEMSLQTSNAPVILTGIMRPTNDRPAQIARAWLSGSHSSNIVFFYGFFCVLYVDWRL